MASFWTRVEIGAVDECWPWTGPRFHFGHGAAWVKGRQYRSHRFVWEATRGPIPDGLCVLHRCDNPPCCNPMHLFLGTKADNSHDRHAKGRTARGERNGRWGNPNGTGHGEANGNAKLAADDVRRIRAARLAG